MRGLATPAKLGIGTVALCALALLAYWLRSEAVVAAQQRGRPEAARASAGAGAPALLPEGGLRPPQQGESEQRRALQSLVKACAHTETTQFEGDVCLLMVEKHSPAEYEALIKGIERSAHEGDEFDVPERKAYLAPTTKRIRWAFSGPKVRYEIQVVREMTQDAKDSDYVERLYDGICSYLHHPVKRQLFMSAGRHGHLKEVEASWRTLTTSTGRPFSEVLQTAGAVYEGRQVIGDTDCFKVSVPRGAGKFDIWLAPTYGYRAKRARSSFPDESGALRVGNVMEVESFAECGGSWFPTKGRNVRFMQTDAGKDEWRRSVEWRVVSYTPDAADCLFKMRPPLGTRVFDNTTRRTRTYTVGGDVEETTSSHKEPKRELAE